MKKTLKMLLAFVAGAMALSACSNEDIDNDSKGSAKLVTLTAYQEVAVMPKAVIDATDSKQIDWSASDKINYFGATAGQSMTLKTGAGTTSGTFEGSVTTSANDYVLYPYQSTATCATGVITAEVPMTQYAVENSFDPAAALMVGKVNGTNVQFKNVMSYVKVTIPSDMTNCKQVSLKAKDAWTTVAGKVNITASTGVWAETTAKEGQAFVRLVPTAPATKLTAGATYYIAILPQTMATGFELIFNDNDVIKVKQSASSSVEFGRSITKKLGAITSFTYTVGTTDLTKVTGTSLKMADRNIGAATTESTDYGDYFAWGALRPAYKTKAMSGNKFTDLYWTGGFSESNVPSSFTDIAAMLWGSKWRMPTRGEWESNLTNSSVTSLPLAGCYNATTGNNVGSNGYYSSSTLKSGTTNAYLLQFSSSNNSVSSRYNYCGYSVRPVLAQ